MNTFKKTDELLLNTLKNLKLKTIDTEHAGVMCDLASVLVDLSTSQIDYKSKGSNSSELLQDVDLSDYFETDNLGVMKNYISRTRNIINEINEEISRQLK